MSFLLATAEVLTVAPFFPSDACICTQVLGKRQDRRAGHPLQPRGITACFSLMCSTSTREEQGQVLCLSVPLNSRNKGLFVFQVCSLQLKTEPIL